jgi:hypothetical protein
LAGDASLKRALSARGHYGFDVRWTTTMVSGDSFSIRPPCGSLVKGKASPAFAHRKKNLTGLLISAKVSPTLPSKQR